MNPGAHISRFFKVYEVSKSPTATRLGIDNTPPSIVLERASYLAREVLDPLRVHFGPLSPQSWYRSEEFERHLTWNSGFKRWCAKHHVDQDDASWDEYFVRKSHPLGEAVDIEYPNISNRYLFDWMKEHTRSFDQLILEFHSPGDIHSGWVHVSCKVEGNRNQAFLI
jgi:hypothetical protein